MAAKKKIICEFDTALQKGVLTQQQLQKDVMAAGFTPSQLKIHPLMTPKSREVFGVEIKIESGLTPEQEAAILVIAKAIAGCTTTPPVPEPLFIHDLENIIPDASMKTNMLADYASSESLVVGVFQDGMGGSTRQLGSFDFVADAYTDQAVNDLGNPIVSLLFGSVYAGGTYDKSSKIGVGDVVQLVYDGATTLDITATKEWVLIDNLSSSGAANLRIFVGEDGQAFVSFYRKDGVTIINEPFYADAAEFGGAF
jgi:hypothetical protein